MSETATTAARTRQVHPERYKWIEGRAVAVIYLDADECEAVAAAMGPADAWSDDLNATAAMLRRLNGAVDDEDGPQ